MDPNSIDTEGSMLETSGLTTRLISPSFKMVGVKPSATPNCLNSMVVLTDPPALFCCATGTGYSPPARKLAVSPDMATRLGSARVLARFLVSSASIRSSRSLLNRALIAPKLSTRAPPARMLVSPVMTPTSSRLPLMKLLTLSRRFLAVERCISTKRTDSITCCVPSTLSMFTTFSGA